MRKEKTELDKVCAVCEHSRPLAEGEHVLCVKKGVVSEFYCCRSFIYDPLKRLPASSLRPAPEGMRPPSDEPEQLTIIPEEDDAKAGAKGA
jgi:hypothetical protein